MHVKNQNLLLSNGEYGIIESIEVDSLDRPETTYNLEVEDYHTYYVGNNEVLVHNKCAQSDSFDDWLNKGEEDHVVYKGVKENKEVYTGITKQDINVRLNQHNRSGKELQELKIIKKNLTRNQARAIETYRILNDGTSGMNKMLSISKKNKFFAQAMEWAAKNI